VLSLERIDALAFIWIGALCAKSSAVASCLFSFSTLFGDGLREVNPSVGGDAMADDDGIVAITLKLTITFNRCGARRRPWTWAVKS
jgi:hypothetical protein